MIDWINYLRKTSKFGQNIIKSELRKGNNKTENFFQGKQLFSEHDGKYGQKAQSPKTVLWYDGSFVVMVVWGKQRERLLILNISTWQKWVLKFELKKFPKRTKCLLIFLEKLINIQLFKAYFLHKANQNHEFLILARFTQICEYFEQISSKYRSKQWKTLKKLNFQSIEPFRTKWNRIWRFHLLAHYVLRTLQSLTWCRDVHTNKSTNVSVVSSLKPINETFLQMLAVVADASAVHREDSYWWCIMSFSATNSFNLL